ncbi:Uma2 family endonuclease [Dyadobacter chenwenxiniae]|uniref:Uma2 family endonuclease n=1 Tax=Dyadobacter chenwenxiniae TaxID=2906456 RepID=UPI001F297BB8|nr:Uma2 family endonuclease [Dyadobacter chenwenxiniae]
MSKSIGHMIASSNPQKVLPKNISAKNIPDVLIHEIIDGIPLYRKGYRDVLAKTKTVEEIMGCSSLQFFIIDYILRVLYKAVDETKYIIATNEAGLHIDKRNNISGDIMIFDKNVLTIDKIDTHYSQVHPMICIEIDLDVELERFTESGYITIKTQKLLDFGTDKVIWFLTKPKSVMIATKDNDWRTFSWDQDIEMLDGICCNVGKYLKEKGSEFA